MKGSEEAHGAATIINAIATGKGAAFGLDLRTQAEVELDRTGRIKVKITGVKGEDGHLVQLCARRIINRFAPGEGYGARVQTSSNIPISKGLKSSSAAANAVILATLSALEVDMDPVEAVKIGTRAAIDAGVSVTGAFDDACASMLGGLVVTDNRTEHVLKRCAMPEEVKVLIHIPDFQIRKQGLPLTKMRSFASLIDLAFDKVIEGNWQDAMLLNSFCYSAALKLDNEVVMQAMGNGAIAAGISGTGPATVIVVRAGDEEHMLDVLGGGKDFIVTDIYNGKE